MPKASARWFSALATTNALPSPAAFLRDESCAALHGQLEPGDARRELASTLAGALTIAALLLVLGLACMRSMRSHEWSRARREPRL